MCYLLPCQTEVEFTEIIFFHVENVPFTVLHGIVDIKTQLLKI